MYIAILIVFLACMGWWLFVHIDYAQTLKHLAPSEYGKVKGFKLFTTNGFPWIEHALTRNYLSLEMPEITVAGNRLCKAYDLVGKIIGLGVLALVIGGFIYAVWFIIKNVT